MGNYVNIIQIILSVALIAAIVLQSKGAGLGGLSGGSEGGGVFRARRGVEKLLFNITIVLAIAFFVTAVINVVVTNQQV
ncbi:MAG: preprotein translocase subunit SecG [Chloroflexi bacterium]|nr:preprotein translocase subunit SecG [Chloroflexota bacterium]MBI5349636.1 preprotein translocase subunit SecG [Chloroflexota bacterium]MBI5712093.1 preprotein translocase subunit SecG [Chloroflexota bacterium]